MWKISKVIILKVIWLDWRYTKIIPTLLQLNPISILLCKAWLISSIIVTMMEESFLILTNLNCGLHTTKNYQSQNGIRIDLITWDNL